MFRPSSFLSEGLLVADTQIEQTVTKEVISWKKEVAGKVG